MGRGIAFRRRGYGSRRITPREALLVLTGGIALGLIYTPVLILFENLRAPGVEAPLTAPADPFPQAWQASRESAAILRAQEGRPDSALAGNGQVRGGGVKVPTGAAIRVIDGDTFWLGGDKIRIADIDTPETHPPRCAYEAELGERATRRLQVLLGQGPFVLQAIDRDTDRYGRKLRIVTRGGRSLGDQLVAEGLARPYAGGRRPWCG